MLLGGLYDSVVRVVVMQLHVTDVLWMIVSAF